MFVTIDGPRIEEETDETEEITDRDGARARTMIGVVIVIGVLVLAVVSPAVRALLGVMVVLAVVGAVVLVVLIVKEAAKDGGAQRQNRLVDGANPGQTAARLCRRTQPHADGAADEHGFQRRDADGTDAADQGTRVRRLRGAGRRHANCARERPRRAGTRFLARVLQLAAAPVWHRPLDLVGDQGDLRDRREA